MYCISWHLKCHLGLIKVQIVVSLTASVWEETMLDFDHEIDFIEDKWISCKLHATANIDISCMIPKWRKEMQKVSPDFENNFTFFGQVRISFLEKCEIKCTCAYSYLLTFFRCRSKFLKISWKTWMTYFTHAVNEPQFYQLHF